MKVTFDTNCLERATRPERYPKDKLQPAYLKVHRALRTGAIKGYFSQTLITLEGVQNDDRVDVLGSTRLETRSYSTGPNAISLSIGVRQDQRPIHPEHARCIVAARALGMKALRGPVRLGDSFTAKDEDGSLYERDDSVERMIARGEKENEVELAIAKRAVGRTIAVTLGLKFSQRAGHSEWWFAGLKRIQGPHERGEVNRAIAEWADGESIIAHIGYGFDLFCTNDNAKRGNVPSIFAPDNKAWLSSAYGVTFVTLEELAAKLP